MKTICADEIKNSINELGADLCGIASIDRFSDAPEGFHPTDIMKECKSVVVIAVKLPGSTISAPSLAPYTFMLLNLFQKVDSITFQICCQLESLGCSAVPIPSNTPYEYWDDRKKQGKGILSLKHAAVRAGLGTMGKNTLLVNDKLGNRVVLGAILADKELTPDPLATYEACIGSCRICLDSCPTLALDGNTIDQQKCRSIVGKSSPGGEFMYNCNQCRKVCPRQNGIL